MHANLLHQLTWYEGEISTSVSLIILYIKLHSCSYSTFKSTLKYLSTFNFITNRSYIESFIKLINLLYIN